MITWEMPEEIRRRIENGGEMLRRRTEEASKRRLTRWQELRVFIANLIPPDLLPYLEPLKEQPENHPDYYAWLHIGELAAIGIRMHWHHSQERWEHGWWIGHGPSCGMYAIQPYRGANPCGWEYADTIDEAIARAYELSLHYASLGEPAVQEMAPADWFTRWVRRWLPGAG